MKIIKVIFEEKKEILDTSGAHYQGAINDTSYDEIVSAFGNPNGKGDGYKVQIEWIIDTPSGVATIYDWKESKEYNGVDEGKHYKDVKTWHIGGLDSKVVMWIYLILKQHNLHKR